eukprot:COSAG02_NODE_2773_length_8058_cov_8.208820_2_plen_65_part_00
MAGKVGLCGSERRRRACAFGIGEKEAEDAERHRLAEHIRSQSFVHSDILKDKLDEVRHCARSQL